MDNAKLVYPQRGVFFSFLRARWVLAATFLFAHSGSIRYVSACQPDKKMVLLHKNFRFAYVSQSEPPAKIAFTAAVLSCLCFAALRCLVL